MKFVHKHDEDDTSTFESSCILKGHSCPISSLSFSHSHKNDTILNFETKNEILSNNKSLLASCSSDTTIRLWDTINGYPLQILEGHTGGLSDVQWSHDALQLCSASDDKTVKLWDVSTAKTLLTLRGHLGFVFSAKFSPHKNIIASCSVDECIRLWDVRTGKCEKILMAHSDPVTSIDFSSDGQLIVSSSYDGKT